VIILALVLDASEISVLERLAQGFSRKEIAEDLGTSLSTVHNRIYTAQRRNGCRTIYNLLAWYVREAVLASVQASESPAEIE
jgi:DNA-binding NarL/FixJ family response regulator